MVAVSRLLTVLNPTIVYTLYATVLLYMFHSQLLFISRIYLPKENTSFLQPTSKSRIVGTEYTLSVAHVIVGAASESKTTFFMGRSVSIE